MLNFALKNYFCPLKCGISTLFWTLLFKLKAFQIKISFVCTSINYFLYYVASLPRWGAKLTWKWLIYFLTSSNQRLGRCIRSVFSRWRWFRDGCTMLRLIVWDRGQVCQPQQNAAQTLKSHGITIDTRGKFETTRIVCVRLIVERNYQIYEQWVQILRYGNICGKKKFLLFSENDNYMVWFLQLSCAKFWDIYT